MDEATKKKRKKAAVLWICVILGLCGLCGLLLAFSDRIASYLTDRPGDEETTKPVVSVIYYDYHYSEDQLARYRELDRAVYYSYGN